MVGIPFLVALRKPDKEKLSPYECGFEAFADAREQFDVRFYLICLLFIIFDLEIAFLFPWAVSTWKNWYFWFLVYDDISCIIDYRFYLRMEKRCIRVGVNY